MSIIIKNEIKFASNIIKKIMDSYEKEKFTARELEVMIFIYTQKNTNNKEICLKTGLLETVVSKYVKNLCLNGLVNKGNGISPDYLMTLIMSDALKIDENDSYKYNINLDKLRIFVKKFREIYDVQKCTVREIYFMLYFYCNIKKTITEICKDTGIQQSVVTKHVQKFEKLKFIDREDSVRIIPTTKLNSLVEVIMSEVLK